MPEIPYTRASLVTATQKITTTFDDGIGNVRMGSGTGFWIISDGGWPYFVTNRHNIDPSMHSWFNGKHELRSVTIALRAYDTQAKLPYSNTYALSLRGEAMKLYLPSDGSDVAVLSSNKLSYPKADGARLTGVPISLLSYPEPVEIMESLFFIGFPGRVRKEAEYDLPIARPCNIASLPNIDYSLEDKSIKTTNTCLVSGLSFGGSSGSPVFMEKDDRVELLGIMSGHLASDVIGCDWPNEHPGLSYFTIGASIVKIFSDNNLLGQLQPS